jgi:hypothetical protein
LKAQAVANVSIPTLYKAILLPKILAEEELCSFQGTCESSPNIMTFFKASNLTAKQNIKLF